MVWSVGLSVYLSSGHKGYFSIQLPTKSSITHKPYLVICWSNAHNYVSSWYDATLFIAAISLVDWCTWNKSGRIRVRIIQELVRILADLHQNRIAKGLSFLGALTCKLSAIHTL